MPFTGACTLVTVTGPSPRPVSLLSRLAAVIATAVSSAVVAVSATATGTSLTDVTVTNTVAVSVTPPDVTVYVKLSAPLKLRLGV